MPISHDISSTTRKPGVFSQFKIDGQRRGPIPIDRRVLLVGLKSAAGTVAVRTPTRVLSEEDGDKLGGKGSELALMVRACFRAMRKTGRSCQVWICAETENGGGTAATDTLTVTGTATESGDIKLKIAGRTILVPVASGDVQNTIAAAINTAIGKVLHDLPVTTGVATNVVTLTSVHKGPNGNDLKRTVEKSVAGVTVTPADGASGAGAYDITLCLDAAVDQTYHAVAIANHGATDITDLIAFFAVAGSASAKRWAMAVIAETGSLATAQALATASNRMEQVIVTAEEFTNMPGEIAAQVATTFESQEDPAMPFYGDELDLYLPPEASVPTDAEIESAIAGGMTILSVNAQKTQATIVRGVTSKVTHNSVPFDTVSDVQIVRTLFGFATEVGIRQALFQSEPSNKKKSKAMKKRLRSLIYNTAKLWESLERLQNVDEHAEELQVEDDVAVPSRVVTAIPTSAIPGAAQLVNVFTLFVE